MCEFQRFAPRGIGAAKANAPPSVADVLVDHSGQLAKLLAAQTHATLEKLTPHKTSSGLVAPEQARAALGSKADDPQCRQHQETAFAGLLRGQVTLVVMRPWGWRD